MSNVILNMKLLVALLVLAATAVLGVEGNLRSNYFDGDDDNLGFRGGPRSNTIDDAVLNWWAQKDEDNNLGFRGGPRSTIDDAVLNWWAQKDEDDDLGFQGRTKCMFLGGQCPFNGKGCCQGRPPWSNQYKVDCINGRCKRIAKCMFLGGQCPYNGKGCCQGRPPWSNQYKVDCINGRCKRIAK